MQSCMTVTMCIALAALAPGRTRSGSSRSSDRRDRSSSWAAQRRYDALYHTDVLACSCTRSNAYLHGGPCKINEMTLTCESDCTTLHTRDEGPTTTRMVASRAFAPVTCLQQSNNAPGLSVRHGATAVAESEEDGWTDRHRPVFQGGIWNRNHQGRLVRGRGKEEDGDGRV